MEESVGSRGRASREIKRNVAAGPADADGTKSDGWAAAAAVCRAVDWNADRDDGARELGVRIYVMMETSTR